MASLLPVVLFAALVNLGASVEAQVSASAPPKATPPVSAPSSRPASTTSPSAPPPAAATSNAKPAPSEPPPALDRARLEAMLDAGDSAMIIQSFRRHPGDVLPFIDDYLEGGLAIIEQSKDADAPTRALRSFRTGVKFADLANQAFGEAIFTEYAAGFASWSTQEQHRFREAQRLFRDARAKAKEAPAEALPMHRRSLASAEALGDHWGVAMNQLAIAEVCRSLGRFQEGHDASIKAMELFGRLQLRPSYVKALITCGELRQQLQLPDQGSGQFRMALQMLDPDASPDERKAIVEALVAALEKIGRKDEADKVRQAEAVRGG
ncbi:MAG: hypothetical protein U0575_15655 [Phycisphaerales bacterium]